MLMYFSMYSRVVVETILRGSLDPTQYTYRQPAVLFVVKEKPLAQVIIRGSTLLLQQGSTEAINYSYTTAQVTNVTNSVASLNVYQNPVIHQSTWIKGQ